MWSGSRMAGWGTRAARCPGLSGYPLYAAWFCPEPPAAPFGSSPCWGHEITALIRHCKVMQRLPPKGSEDIGVHVLPRAFMVNHPNTSSRSDMCLSVAGGIQRLKVKIVIGQLDPFEILLRCLLFTVLSRAQIWPAASYHNKCRAQWVVFLRALSKDWSHRPWFPLLGDAVNPTGARVISLLPYLRISVANWAVVPASLLPKASESHNQIVSTLLSFEHL